jgi:hypothetical protein
MHLLAPWLIACAAPPEAAPLTLEEATRQLLVRFDEDDVTALAAELSTRVDEARDELSEGAQLTLLTDEEVDGIDHDPDTDLSLAYGAALAVHVRGSVSSHAAVVPEADQTFCSDSYDRYDRSIVEGSAATYLSGGDLRTENAIEKDVGLAVLPYPMSKAYRWVSLPAGTAQVARSVIHDAGYSADGKTGVVVGFTIELWLPDGEEAMLWYNATWTQVASPVELGEEFLVNQILGGARDEITTTELYVAGEPS